MKYKRTQTGPLDTVISFDQKSHDCNILDLTFLVDYVFRLSGDPGPCASESDADADGSPVPTILDLTYVVDKVFRQGPLPTSCPL